MARKYFFVVLFLVIFALPGQTIHALATGPEKNSVDAKIESEVSSFIPNVTNFIKNHTPEFIKNSISSATKITEEFRIDLAEKLEIKKTTLEIEVAYLKADKPDSDRTWKEKATPTLKKVELFFTKASFIVMSSKILFYGLSLIILIWLIRLVSARIF